MTVRIDESDLIEHKVIIDEYTSLNINLPREIDALVLMATLQRLKGILKVTALQSSSSLKGSRGKYKSDFKGSLIKHWTAEEDAIIQEAVEDKTFKGNKQEMWAMLSKKIDRTATAIQMRHRVNLGIK